MNPAEPPPLDSKWLASVLDRHGVEYVLVGGLAARAHGAKRPTRDFDCLVRHDDRENLTRLAVAMRELNARLVVEGMSDVEAAQLPVVLDALTLESLEISTWRTDAGDLDVLVNTPDRDGNRRSYEEVWASSVKGILEGVEIRILSIDDLIASKEWANRPKDRAALPELRRLQDPRRQERGL